MALILATGSNLGNRRDNLELATNLICGYFTLEAFSDIIETEPVDYLEQPAFLNQVLQFTLPDLKPLDILRITQSVEQSVGRHKTIDKGPREIDVDIIFYSEQRVNAPNLIIPHSSWDKRPFVYNLIKQLPAYKKLSETFPFPE